MDPAQVEALYLQYADDVLRVSYFYLGDRANAEDVTQDVFLRLMRANPDLAPGKKGLAAEGGAQPLPGPVAFLLAQAGAAGQPQA